MNINEVPVVELEGSEPWRDGYKWGSHIDDLFPGQDGYDFAIAVQYHGEGPLFDNELDGLLMVQQGAPDSGDWTWLVKLDNGKHWWLEGWCDYTGWDCQSGAEWSEYE